MPSHPQQAPLWWKIATVGVPRWQEGTKVLYLYSQSSQACKPIHRALILLTTALMEWNVLHTIVTPGV